LRAIALCATSLLAAAAPAQGLLDAKLTSQVEQFALDAVRHQAPGRRVEVLVGKLDARLRLAPCQRAQPYLTGSARLWGRSRIGLRCLEGPAAWNVFVPVTVKVFGPAYVTAAPLPAGSVIGLGDLAQAEVDLAESPSIAFTDPARAAGRTLTRAMAAGQVLRESHLRPRIWFAAGDEVRLVARGSGFQAVSTGHALTVGIEGQPARARTESGRVVVGSPVGQKEIDLTQ
jgi:flagella basal body P-ring formation protein FlgA